MKLIVNADDFGLDELTTLAIDEAMRSGICSGTTLMVNMPYAKYAVELARANGYFERVGLHLNLTVGRPLTEAIRRSAEFCDENGLFDGRFRKKRRLSIGGEMKRLLREEVHAQIIAFKGYKPPVFHLDSHHHVHAEWAFIAAVKDIIGEENVQSIRISRNISVGDSPLYSAYKALINAQIHGTGVQTTDYFTDATEAGLLMKFSKSEQAIAEIMLHPRRDSREGPLLDRASPMADSEKAIRSLQCEMISYAELCRDC